MTETIFFSQSEDIEMEKASINARKSFKILWRELSWEIRRVIPAIDPKKLQIEPMLSFDKFLVIPSIELPEYQMSQNMANKSEEGIKAMGRRINDPLIFGMTSGGLRQRTEYPLDEESLNSVVRRLKFVSRDLQLIFEV